MAAGVNLTKSLEILSSNNDNEKSPKKPKTGTSNTVPRPKNTPRKTYVTEDGTEKVYIQVLVRREVYDKLVQHIAGAERVRGVISEIVERALVDYLNKNPRPQPVAGSRLEWYTKKYREILETLAKNLGEESVHDIVGKTVREGDLAAAINFVCGKDRRTVEKWIKYLVEDTVIKYIDGFTPHRVYKVLRIP